LTFGPNLIHGRQVYGTAQVTSNPNHATHIDAIVQQLTAQAPEGTYFVLNRTWRTALGRHLVHLGTEASRTKPDILIVQQLDAARQNWRVHAIEVLSGDQTKPGSIAHLNVSWNDKVLMTLPNTIGSVQKRTFDAVAPDEFPHAIQWS
jgi:hypothetical protein